MKKLNSCLRNVPLAEECSDIVAPQLVLKAFSVASFALPSHHHMMWQ